MLQEVSAGDPTAARDRLATIASLLVLAFGNESAELSRHLIQGHAIHSGEGQYAAHVAIATVNRVDYLATWNFRHIANPRLIPLIDKSCRDMGYSPVVICTPSQLDEHNAEDAERDPILAELRQIRAQVVAEAGNDPKAIMKYAGRKRGAAAESGRQSAGGEDASPTDECAQPSRTEHPRPRRKARFAMPAGWP